MLQILEKALVSVSDPPPGNYNNRSLWWNGLNMSYT